MAQRLHTVLVSDLSGDEVEDGLESVTFGYQGVDYVIDLTAKEAAGFERAIAMYVEHARPARRRSTGRTGSSAGGTSRARSAAPGHAERVATIKAWATEQGLDYPQRGRLPQSLVSAYDAQH